jgi:sortase A
VIRAAVRGLGELLITAGLLLLLFASWQLWWTDVEGARDQRAIAEGLRDDWRDDGLPPVPPTGVPAGNALSVGEPPVLDPPATGEAFALVHVPRFGADHTVPAEQGVGLKDVLNHGVLGHYPDTAMPGGVGNFALAGHRVTYGRPLNRIAELTPGDPVVVETEDAWYVYRVRDASVVSPGRVDVVAPVPGDVDATPTERLLTLTACHPMYSARQRYVVHAVLEGWQPRSQGSPDVLAAG